jgi:hypothetical protein
MFESAKHVSLSPESVNYAKKVLRHCAVEVKQWRHDIQPNDIQQNDAKHNRTLTNAQLKKNLHSAWWHSA